MKTWLDNKWIVTGLMVLWVALAPIRPAMAATMALPVIDLALALIIARRAKAPITSSGLKRTIAKILMYEIALILAFITETNLTGDIVPAIKIVTGLIGMTELKSCLEHLDELSGGSTFQAILSKLAPPPNE